MASALRNMAIHHCPQPGNRSAPQADRRRSLDELFEAGNEDDRLMTFEVADDEPTPFDRFANVEDRERISAALLQLDTLYREVLVLRFHEELSRRDCQDDESTTFYSKIKTLSGNGRNQAAARSVPRTIAGRRCEDFRAGTRSGSRPRHVHE